MADIFENSSRFCNCSNYNFGSNFLVEVIEITGLKI